MSLIAKVDGQSGVRFAFTKLIISLLMFALLYLICRRRNLENPLALAFSSVISIFISFRLILRAENLAFILFLSFIYIFQIYIETKNKLTGFLLILITIAWVNSHGSFVLIFVYFFLHLVSILIDVIRRKTVSSKLFLSCLILFFLMLLATLINPYGYNVWIRALSITIDDYLKDLIAEWQPTFSIIFSQTPSFYFYLLFAVLSCSLILKNIRRIKTTDFLIYLAFFFLSFFALRHIAYFYLASAGIVAGAIAISSERTKKYILFGFTILILSNIIFVTEFGNYNQINLGTKFDAPLELDAIKWLKEKNVSGPVLNSYELGDQIIYNFYPKILVAIDSRADLYGENYSNKYRFMMHDTKRFLEFIDFFKIKVIVLTVEDFDHYFTKNPDRLTYLDKIGWRIGFNSEFNVILVDVN